MTTEEVAFSLLARLHSLTGSAAVTQADLVLCEDRTSYMAYLYDAVGGCYPLCFDIPAGGVDADAVQAALEGHVVGTVH